MHATLFLRERDRFVEGKWTSAALLLVEGSCISRPRARFSLDAAQRRGCRTRQIEKASPR
jgi:hypothetical protein